jgi:hypothetical protein
MIENADMDFYDQRINNNKENIKVVTSIYEDKCIACGSLFLEH